MPELTQREKLKKLLEDKAASAEPSDGLRLAPGQLRLWEMERGALVPNIHVFSIAYYLSGPLIVELLEQSLAFIASQYLGLHSRIVENDIEPFFERCEAPTVKHIDTSSDAADLTATLRREAAVPIDPKAAAPWRCVLIRRSAQEYVLLLCFHHIIADRWSVGVLIEQLGAAYAVLQEGTQPAVQSQSSVPNDEPDEAGLRYWQSVFQSGTETLRLPLGHDLESFGDYAGDCLEAEIDPHTVSILKDLTRAHSITLFPILLSAFAVMLRAHTGQTELLICTPMTGRTRSSVRNAVGYFNNIVPLRLDVSGDPAFVELVGRVSAVARGAFEHQTVPFQTIAALRGLQRVRASRCLFSLQNIPRLQLRLPEITTSYQDIPNGTANFDLSLFLEEKDGKLHIVMPYKTHHFSAEKVSELNRRFVECLQRLAAHPTQNISVLLEEKRDWQSSPATESRVATSNEGREPAQEVVQRVMEIWRSLFSGVPSEQVHSSSNFFELGGDSIIAAKLFTQIRKEFNADLPLTTLLEAPTPRRLAQCLNNADSNAAWAPVTALRTTGSRPNLFFMPGGGGNILSFRKLAELLGDDQPVYALRAQGLKRGEDALATVEEMAVGYLKVIQSVQPHGPYMFVGHSIGAAVAYEMAQQLIAKGETVALVGLLDHSGPDIKFRASDWLRFNLMSLTQMNARERMQFIYRGVRWKIVSRLANLRARGGDQHLSSKAASEWSSIDVIEGSMQALRNYKVKPLDGKVVLFRCEIGSPKIRADRFGGWGGVAKRGVRVFEVPGEHMTMLAEPHVYGLGKALAESIEEVLSGKQLQATAQARS